MADNNEKQGAAIGQVEQREIVEEMRGSYIDYAMSVIVARALPDVRDGLKPVHRRILFAMQEEGLTHGAKYRKSATVVGSTLGRYHPHGDLSVYDAMVRMAQDFSLRYMLVDGQGNFGCFTGDTKVKLTDGRSLSFAELVREHKAGRRNWTFSFNGRDQKIEIAEVKNPRVTKSNAKLVEVELDNGQKIKCTPGHRFMLRDGSYCEAKDLQSKDSLMPLYTKEYDGKKDKNLKGYKMILQPFDQAWQFIHRLADDWNLQENAYAKSAGRIRHHLDFNKHNNNPDNIKRLQWKEHWKIHYEMASWRHKNDPEYVKKIAEGRRKYIEANHDLLSQRAKNLNKKLWSNPAFREAHTYRIKTLWNNQDYKKMMREASSKNLRRLWQRKDFQELLSTLKSEEMKKRWNDEGYRKEMSSKMAEFSRKLWANTEHRKYISRLMKERVQDPEWQEKRRKSAKALWNNPLYREKYPKNHFQSMAKSLWENPRMKEFHREKLLKQRQNPAFLKRNREGLQQLYKERVAENPNYMKELAQKSASSLRARWTEPSYKEQVMKSRILGFVSAMLSENETITPETYNQARTNNGIPRAEKVAGYFGSFAILIEEAKSYNHRVVRVRRLKKREDVYDITIDSWHNFALDAGIFVHNSIDGDPAAAMRYSEARMSRMGEAMLQDISKNTVDFVDNYDGSRQEPTVLPSPVPQLLLNGTLGIAVGMATNIPPHNIREVIDAAVYVVDNPKATTEDLFQFIKGPDFPTGGIIYNKKEILEAYSQGKGPIVTRGKAEIVEGSTPRQGSGQAKRTQIVITEIPYQVNKSTLVEQFAKLVQDKKIDGIKDIRDESDKDGMRIVFDLQRDAQPQKILNRLYKFSDLQRSFHLNMIALVDGLQPKVLSLVEFLEYFIEHRREVIKRRTQYDVDRAKEREHILEGLHKCLAHIDEVIKIIRKAADRPEAQKSLMKRFRLTEIQADAILDTRLAQLARLERQKIEDELKEIRAKIAELSAILASSKKIDAVLKKELARAQEMFGDERRTKVVVQGIGEIAEEDLIPQEEAIITLTQGGYIKRINPATYKIQKRGGKGIMGMKTVSDDIIEHFLPAQTHDSLMLFSDSGKVFQTPVYEIPEGTRVSKGRGLLNFLEMSQEDKVLSLFALGKEDVEAGVKYLVMVTKNGVIKKTPLEDFKNVRRSGLIAITLKKGDALWAVRKTTGNEEIIITTKKGQAIRFKEKDVRSMGRTAAGIHGIRLKKGDEVVGMDVFGKQEKERPQHVLVVTENGYGKRTEIKEYRVQTRGGSGIKTANVTVKTGELVYSCVLTGDEEDLIVISRKGTVIRTAIDAIPKISRSTQGVRIMKLESGDKVASAACV